MSVEDLDDLNSWIEEIRNEIGNLHVQRYFFKESEKILLSNQQLIHLNSDYFYSVKSWYEASMSVSIRRLIDTDDRTRSFRRFLEKVKRNCSRITRSRYKSLRAEGLSKEAAAIDAEFDRLAGIGERYLQKNTVEADLLALNSELKKIENFATQAIAHRQSAPTYDLPKHSDIDEALEFTGSLLDKYSRLIVGYGVGELLPYMPEDWKDVFRYAWIASS